MTEELTKAQAIPYGKRLLLLFLSFLKIGAFTFGGGYAMIALLQREFVERKEWISQEEFTTLIAIAESTPGPIAINSATYIGYRVAGVFGAILSTLGVVLPSFTVIYLISLFYEAFRSLTLVDYAFQGIRVAVIVLIFTAGLKMFRNLTKNLFNVLLFSVTGAVMLAFSLFDVSFSSIFYILISAFIGVVVYLIKTAKEKAKGKEEKKI